MVVAITPSHLPPLFGVRRREVLPGMGLVPCLGSQAMTIRYIYLLYVLYLYLNNLFPLSQPLSIALATSDIRGTDSAGTIGPSHSPFLFPFPFSLGPSCFVSPIRSVLSSCFGL